MFALQDASRQVESHRPQYQRTHQMAEEVIQDPVVKDASHVTSMMNNMDSNWRTLEDIINSRWVLLISA